MSEWHIQSLALLKYQHCVLRKIDKNWKLMISMFANKGKVGFKKFSFFKMFAK